MRILLIVLLLVVGAGHCPAAPVSESLARQAASDWLAAYASDPSQQRTIVDRQSLEIEGAAAIWIYSFRPAGFVILAADDRVPPVLGYADDAQAPAGITHPPLLAHLESCLEQIRWVLETGEAHPAAREEWDRLLDGSFPGPSRDREVLPLIDCTWNQGWPYNMYCPEDGDGPGGHVWAGCVATAMAQAMKYWESPVQGQGSHSYTLPLYGQLSADFGATTYNWPGMPDASGNSDVALLMYHCGVAVNMQYSPWGSGAYVGYGSQSALHAFETYFRYPSMCEFYERNGYDDEEWHQLLRDDLDLGRPIVYRGQGGGGGHAFNIDGYQDNDYYHLNWGWSGYYNGYFTLDNLAPGGSDFSSLQGGILHLESNTPPTVEIPDQTVYAGQPFEAIHLDDHVSDVQDDPDELVWWTEWDMDLDVDIDYVTRIATVEYPEGWLGSETVLFQAIDLDGDWDGDEVTFTVMEGAPPAPAAVDDLHIESLADSFRLSWSAPETDEYGGTPVYISGYAIHASEDPWYAPGPGTLLETVQDTSYVHEPDLLVIRRLAYRVVALGLQ